jgi:DNA-binding MarR family transcriptional regulator
LNSLYDEALRPAGLKSTQYNQLICLEMMGETTVKSLAQALAVDRTSLTRSLEPLERIGLVSSRSGSDGRERLVQLTLKGRSSLKKAMPLWESAQAAVTSALGEDTVETLFASAESIEKALGPNSNTN